MTVALVRDGAPGRQPLVHRLLTGVGPDRERAARELRSILADESETHDHWFAVAICGVRGPTRPHRSELATLHPSRSTSPVLQSAEVGHHVVLLPDDQTDAVPTVAAITRAARDCCRHPVAGVGEARPLVEAVLSYAQAKAAMSAAGRLPHLPEIVRYVDLGAERVLASRSDVDLAASVDPQIRLLLDHGDPDLVPTLTAFLDSGGDANATAALLAVHRGTLYYRLRKARDLSGLDLSRGASRYTAHLSLLAHQLLSSPSRPAHPGAVHLLPV